MPEKWGIRDRNKTGWDQPKNTLLSLGKNLPVSRKVKGNGMSIFLKSTFMPERKRSSRINPELRKAVDIALRHMRATEGFEKVRFVMLYGSSAEGHATNDSDIDLCVYYDGDKKEAAQYRHAILSRLPSLRYDIQVFQLLPLYVRIEILRGIPVFVRNRRFLYETAVRTLREFGDFKHRLYDYTGQAAMQ